MDDTPALALESEQHEKEAKVENEPVASEQPQAGDDEDFGDFGDFDKGGESGGVGGDDDFGAFGDFDSAPAPPPQPSDDPTNTTAEGQDTAAMAPSFLLQPPIPDDEFEANFISQLLIANPSSWSEKFSDELANLVSISFPVPTRPSDCDAGNLALFQSPISPTSSNNMPNTKQLLELSAEFGENPESKDVYDFWTNLQTQNIYNDQKSMFQWRKSMIRTAFLESISNLKFDPFANRPGGSLGSRNNSKEGLNHAADSGGSKPNISGAKPALSTSITPSSVPSRQPSSAPVVHTTAPPLSTNDSTVDSREEEMGSAKRLCDIPEDEIRKMTRQELRDFISNLNVGISQMQDQANYWLDSKEQLVMESEMHNKMIASLVTYAQQKHSNPATDSKKTSKKK